MIKKIIQFVLKHKVVMGIVILSIISISYFSYSHFFKNKDEALYVTTSVEKGTLTVSVSGTGNVVADESAEINAEISGTISAINISVGDKVEKDQMLFTIDNDELTAASASALVALSQAKEDVEKTKLDREQFEQTLIDLIQRDNNNPLSVSDLDIEMARQKFRAANLAVQSAETKVDSANIAYNKAKEAAAKRSVRSPIAGTVTELAVEVGDEISTGGGSSSSASVASNQENALITVINLEKLSVQISLNEVDVLKVKNGQKTTFTFDALEDLTLTGTVVDIDPIGTVTQGVVTYDVRVAFDTIDERVKPGMSVSSSIITDVKQDVLLVPNSAIKSNNAGQYVETLVDGAPRTKSVEIGLTNDTMTEIISGLNEGDQIITQTIATTDNDSQSQTQQNNNGFRVPGITGGGEPSSGGGFISR